MSAKLTEGQLEAIRWASGKHASHWGGKIMGSPPKATVNALLRRGLLERVGVRSMDLYAATSLGHLALSLASQPADQTRQGEPDHG